MDNCLNSSFSKIHIPENMTHNKENILHDIIVPLKLFFKDLSWELNTTSSM